jgi:hypothetical protein
MTFNRILFYYDLDGHFLGRLLKDGTTEEEPFELKAEHCNARYFSIMDTIFHESRSNVPALQVRRVLGPLRRDPYNEDNSPPTVMFTLVLPHIQHMDQRIIVDGLEQPNMSWAGILLPPYTRDYKPLYGVRYMTPEQGKASRFRHFEFLYRQRVVLYRA